MASGPAATTRTSIICSIWPCTREIRSSYRRSSVPRRIANSCSSTTAGFAGWPCANFAGPPATPIIAWRSWISCGHILQTKSGHCRTSNIGPTCCSIATQAATLAKLEESGADAAVQELNQGLERFRDLFSEYDAEDQYDDDEMVQRLLELKAALPRAI